jgi:hypothetical protein
MRIFVLFALISIGTGASIGAMQPTDDAARDELGYSSARQQQLQPNPNPDDPTREMLVSGLSS